MSARVIIEVRHKGEVSRIERDVSGDGYPWRDPEPSVLAECVRAAAAEMSALLAGGQR